MSVGPSSEPACFSLTKDLYARNFAIRIESTPTVLYFDLYISEHALPTQRLFHVSTLYSFTCILLNIYASILLKHTRAKMTPAIFVFEYFYLHAAVIAVAMDHTLGARLNHSPLIYIFSQMSWYILYLSHFALKSENISYFVKM